MSAYSTWMIYHDWSPWWILPTVVRLYTPLVYLYYQLLANIYVTYLLKHLWLPGLILGLRQANERRSYFVTTSLIGWVRAHNQLCLLHWYTSTHSHLDKMATISQTIFSSASLWLESLVFRFEFHQSLSLTIKLTRIQHSVRWWFGVEQATRHYLNQCWPSSLSSYTTQFIYAPLGGDELNLHNPTETRCGVGLLDLVAFSAGLTVYSTKKYHPLCTIHTFDG